ncbi:MAG: hypothetical protein ACPL0C_06620 [Candidatus Bathyarchaeales archaeon]
MSTKSFQKALLTAIDEGLSSLGDSPKQAILFHIELSFRVKRDEIPEKLTEFSKALEKLFGTGAVYLEKLIVKRLYSMLDLEFEEAEYLDFLNCVENLKRSLTMKKDA